MNTGIIWITFIVTLIVAIAFGSLVTWGAWNLIIPLWLSLPVINYWQAVGLNIFFGVLMAISDTFRARIR